MSPRPRRFAPVGLFATSLGFLLAAAVNALKGQPFKPALFVIAIAFALFGMIAWGKPSGDSSA